MERLGILRAFGPALLEPMTFWKILVFTSCSEGYILLGLCFSWFHFFMISRVSILFLELWKEGEEYRPGDLRHPV